MAIWQVAKTLGVDMLATIESIKATGVKGRMVNGCRVWTDAEVKRLKAHLAGLRVA